MAELFAGNRVSDLERAKDWYGPHCSAEEPSVLPERARGRLGARRAPLCLRRAVRETSAGRRAPAHDHRRRLRRPPRSDRGTRYRSRPRRSLLPRHEQGRSSATPTATRSASAASPPQADTRPAARRSLRTWRGRTTSRTTGPLQVGRRQRAGAHRRVGDTVVVHTRDVSDNQITPDSTERASPASTGTASTRSPARSPSRARSPATRSRSRSSTCTRRAGAGPRSFPGSGCCPTTSPSLPADLRPRGGDFTHLREDIAIPIAPFLGTMGVCPAGASEQAVMPPGIFGGNIDTRQLVRGTTLYLPVQVEGALFSCGDAHAARATARSASRGSSRRCTARCASRWRRTARSRRHSTRPPAR